MTYRYLPANLPDLFRKEGLTVVVLDGWEKRGRPSSTGEFAPVGVLNHHTGASAKTWDKAKRLAYAKWMALTGRSDLPAPLCQLALGPDGTVYVSAGGRANHAGTAKKSGSVAAGDGNKLYVGMEWMLSGVEVIPPEMYAAGVKVNAVLLRLMKSSVRTISCHFQTSVTGKWDIGDPRGVPFGDKRVLDVDKFRAEVQKVLTPPKPPIPSPRQTVTVQHNSMQFSDTAIQQKQDVAAVLSRPADVVTWTESGWKEPLFRFFKEIGPKKGYHVYAHKYGLGVAVKESFGKVLRSGYQPGIGTARPDDPKKFYPRGIAWSEVETTTGEIMTFGAVHYITGGRNPRQGYRYWRNRAYAKVIGAWTTRFGEGRKLAFISGDVNIVDRLDDVFFGQPLTTCWDEIEKWPNTGHGNIDVVASYDADTRVKCVKARVLDDTVFPLHSDHFMIEAVYSVR